MLGDNKTAQLKVSKEFSKELWKAKYYLSKLFKLRAVRIIIICFGILLLIPVPLFLALRPTPQPSINYGVTFSNRYASDLGLDWRDTYLKILDELGVKHIRLVAYWDEIEKTPDSFDFSNIEWQLEEADRRNINVILAVGRKVPRFPECFEPEWWKKIPDERTRDLELYEYVKKAVITLKHHSSIKMWQVENEPYWPFGVCNFSFKTESLRKEIAITRSLDTRPILVQDSGEGGYWLSTYRLGDKLGISMYRKIWYNFWGALFKKFIYFQYPLASWSYKVKAGLVGVPYQDIIVTELQGEPWGPGINSQISNEEKNKTMSRNDFIDTLNYAQKAGFKDLYLWGVEWWYWEKEINGNPYFWNASKALFN